MKKAATRSLDNLKKTIGWLLQNYCEFLGQALSIQQIEQETGINRSILITVLDSLVEEGRVVKDNGKVTGYSNV